MVIDPTVNGGTYQTPLAPGAPALLKDPTPAGLVVHVTAVLPELPDTVAFSSALEFPQHPCPAGTLVDVGDTVTDTVLTHATVNLTLLTSAVEYHPQPPQSQPPMETWTVVVPALLNEPTEQLTF